MKSKHKTFKVDLPPLQVNSDEYAILEELARRKGMTVAELVRELVTERMELADEELGKVVVIQVPHCTYAAFAAWVVGGSESAEDSIARYVAHEGERLEELRYAAAGGQAGSKKTR